MQLGFETRLLDCQSSKLSATPLLLHQPCVHFNGNYPVTWFDTPFSKKKIIELFQIMLEEELVNTYHWWTHACFAALRHLPDAETPLSNAVFCILTEALQRQDHWVCRENVIKAATVLFGKGLNRYMFLSVYKVAYIYYTFIIIPQFKH